MSITDKLGNKIKGIVDDDLVNGPCQFNIPIVLKCGYLPGLILYHFVLMISTRLVVVGTGRMIAQNMVMIYQFVVPTVVPNTAK